MTVQRLSLPSLSAIAVGGFALWISSGTLALTTDAGGAARVGVLPSPWWLLPSLAVVALASFAAGERRSRLLWLTPIVILAWLPTPMPMATFMWAGPLRWWLWTAIAVAAFGPSVWRAIRPWWTGAG